MKAKNKPIEIKLENVFIIDEAERKALEEFAKPKKEVKGK